jgi:hypothetical protein
MLTKTHCALALLFAVAFAVALLGGGREGFGDAMGAGGADGSRQAALATDNAYPARQDASLVADVFPPMGREGVSNDNASDIWWHYPVFSQPSYAQITNNLRYPYNPDVGTCMRAEMCGALYHDRPRAAQKSNVVLPLGPAEQGGGARVGWWRTAPAENRLYWSIPTNENILY